MKIIFTILFTFFWLSIFAQTRSLLNMGNGDINIHGDNCCIEFYGNFPVFNDIAYNNGKIYAVNHNLNIIDFDSKTLIDSFPIYNISGNQIYSDGLEVVNDSLLFLDDQTDLYCFNVMTNNIQFVGNTGYYCSGDFLFLDNKLYMTTDSNELIEIQLSSSYNLIGVSVVDFLSIGSVYGLSKVNKTSELILFSGTSSYKMNENSNEFQKNCDLNSAVNGASYFDEHVIENNFPNIITPNHDNINDFVDLSIFKDFHILNRWGEEVFNITYSKQWRGDDKKGEPVSEGVYFIIIYYEDCETTKSFCQNITILR